jgi:hypothetical protein
MTAATVKIKTRLFERQESIQGLADRWGYSRHLVTKVIHGERRATKRRSSQASGSIYGHHGSRPLWRAETGKECRVNIAAQPNRRGI